MRQSAVLLDTDRVISAAAARLAFHALEYVGRQSLEAWLDERVDQAILDMRTEDEYEAEDGVPVAADDPRYLNLATQLGVDTETMRAGSIVFHQMPHEERAAFWALLIDGQTVEVHARRTRVPVRVATRRFERALLTFCTLGAQRRPPEDPPGGSKKRGRRKR